MAPLSWIGQEAGLTSAALTVLTQAVPVNDAGNGRDLYYDQFFPRRDVDSTNLASITTNDYRPTADRREWNQRGRAVPLYLPPLRQIQMVPVESYYKVNEFELQKLSEETRGNADTIRAVIGNRIPDRTRGLAFANNRRLAVDAFTAWGLGQITARDPQAGATQTVSFGFPATRYTTAGTAWNTVANAYTAFTTWLTAARDLVGEIEGVMLRQATLNEILADAPVAFGYPTGVQPTQRQVEERVQQQFGTSFYFDVNERTVDIFTGAGSTVARTKLWPAQRVAAIPAGRQVGYMAYAPVMRAHELAQAAPEARIDVNGQAAYSELTNGGRELTVEVQVNACPVPDEGNLAVIDAGV